MQLNDQVQYFRYRTSVKLATQLSVCMTANIGPNNYFVPVCSCKLEQCCVSCGWQLLAELNRAPCLLRFKLNVQHSFNISEQQVLDDVYHCYDVF